MEDRVVVDGNAGRGRRSRGRLREQNSGQERQERQEGQDGESRSSHLPALTYVPDFPPALYSNRMSPITIALSTALTMYDMVKAVDKAMVIGDIRLEYKAGGKSGTYVRAGR